MAGDLQEQEKDVGLTPPGGHYSHFTEAGGLVFISGQLPIAPGGRKLADASFDEQALQVMDNVERTLRAAGCGLDSLVQVRIYLDDIDNWPRLNTLYANWLGEHKPARAIVPTPPLHYGFKIEIEAVARASS
ncbi:RidA family protein [Herbaspirillum robiniae]|uniref:RidA family protein n=1 Tax=Herbaspirillum robiniae TaxID=2014887 RepID=UPI003D77B624